MFERVDEPVAVLASFRPGKAGTQVLPHILEWRGRRYHLEIMGLHHPARRGRQYIHVFEFSCASTKFRLELDAETLQWQLTEVFYDHSS